MFLLEKRVDTVKRIFSKEIPVQDRTKNFFEIYSLRYLRISQRIQKN